MVRQTLPYKYINLHRSVKDSFIIYFPQFILYIKYHIQPVSRNAENPEIQATSGVRYLLVRLLVSLYCIVLIHIVARFIHGMWFWKNDIITASSTYIQTYFPSRYRFIIHSNLFLHHKPIFRHFFPDSHFAEGYCNIIHTQTALITH